MTRVEERSREQSAGMRDFWASIVIFLVALPLCLGLAIAAGAPPISGLISGIIGGIVVGSLGGAPLQVSGPANGGLAIVADIITRYSLTGLGVTVILAGLMQILAGAFRLGHWFRAISPAVIQGMLAGIGVIIIASQFHVMLDVTPESSGLANLLSIPSTVEKGLFPTESSTHHWAAMVGLISILVILAWNWMPKLLKIIPGTLVAVAVAIVVAHSVGLPIRYVQLPDSIVSGMTFPSWTSVTMLGDPQIWLLAAMLALVVSAETMLSATVIEPLQKGVRTLYDKEMVAQGIGNTLCGLLGAFPLSGVIARSSVNIQAGAQSRKSAILHGVWMLALVSLFPHVLEMIPTASLAAILVYAGYRLLQPAAVSKLWKIGRFEIVIYSVTLVGVVATNLLAGVLAGSVLAIIKLLYTLSYLEGISEEDADGVVNLQLKGSATFLSLPKLSSIMECQPLGRQLHVHVDTLNFIDHACLELLKNWEKQYKLSGGRLTVEWQALHEKLPGNHKPVENGSAV